MADDSDKKNELQRVPPADLDGIDGWEDRYVDDAKPEAAGSFLAGTIRLSFTNESTWIRAVSKEPVPPDFTLVVHDVHRTIVDWSDKTKPITRALGPGERIPDVEAMNAAVPEKWSTGPGGKLKGLFEFQYVTFLWDLETLDKYSWPTSTVGGGIATRELVNKIKLKRRVHGKHLHPRVLLSDIFMKTNFGGRQRPCLVPKEWLLLGGGEPALSAPCRRRRS